jgi:hypothetical protein
MSVLITVILAVCFILIYITIIRWVFRIDYIASLLQKNSENTFGQFKLLKFIKKQNYYSIEQTKIFLEQQEKMIELLEQGVELLKKNTEN